MQKLLTIIFLLFISACKNQDTKIIDFKAFTIETPKSWQKVSAIGTDSYIGRIAIDGKDTLDFDLGMYSDDLYESDPVILDSSMIHDVDTSNGRNKEIIFVNNSRAIDHDIYKKTNVKWDTIENRKVKIVFPRQIGIGITGIYIDSLWMWGKSKIRFNLYGENLKQENEKQLLNALYTLKFHR